MRSRKIRFLLPLLAALCLAGGWDQNEVAGSRAAEGATASLEGLVLWEGSRPHVPPIEGTLNARVENGLRPQVRHPNPNAPHIDSSGHVESALIWLSHVDVRRSKPWDLPAVHVQLSDYRFHIKQGDADALSGFVHVGDPIDLESTDQAFHAVHGDGAAFFSLMLPDPNQPVSRTLTRPGIVELSSAAGHIWMRAYLLVSEHPYVARTDSNGRFSIRGIPPGDYDVVAWLPNWKEAGHDRDPETALLTRLRFRQPVLKTRHVKLTAGQPTTVEFVYRESDFAQ
jgi:hypothetical protein